ncbi:hypothetical protein W97_07282 [Coniosporium apollinis CBS 100218]|uniref:Calpain catalytic domain-containing protein n=1 Tax=Coniosporium apollinis (strain CBS 100218) TaxID=1168221 RepID=R7Z225_CONA1|nr:uncharacterized protein W97_07282 [Coniosporium apollinis CBS 100218]EON68133.1 hypothetical protein W97_07282 [Coniosporium apollinis CBS 100218]
MASNDDIVDPIMDDNRDRSRSDSIIVIRRNTSSPPPKRKVKKQAPQKSVDEFWNKFTSKHPGKAFTILPDNLYAKRAAAHAPKGVVPGQNAVASYAEAVESCKSKVAKIVKECRRINQKYRDPHFDIETDFKRVYPPDCLTTLDETGTRLFPGSVKRVEDVFEDPAFFLEGATANDVRQGNDGDCWFMSALCTLSNKEGLIEKVCVARDEQVGVYGFVFHRDGEWISEVIDDKLYLIKKDFDDSDIDRYQFLELHNRKAPDEEYRTVFQTGSQALYFAQCSDPNETWLPLLEKAYAKAHGDYSSINGGFVGSGIEDLTGGVTTEVFATDILDKDKFWKEELMNVNKQFLFGCGQMGGLYGQRRGIQEKHAYSIMEAREVGGVRLLKLRNPWGKTEWTGAWSDGSEQWTPEWMTELDHRFGDDGVFWISYKDLLRNYQHFDRTRLFGEEWTVTQQWTSLNVPWSVDYLDTKFKISLDKPGPAVIVLAQLDDRYFRGLEGQYEFHLAFRLHKDDEEDYIVRSSGPYYMKRSVSTELDLKAGNYTVLLKITAVRDSNARAAEEVIRDTCNNRRAKLLATGLSYDLAHAKGQFKESESEKATREKKEERAERKDQAKKRHDAFRKIRQKEKLRRKRKEAKVAERKAAKLAERKEHTPAATEVEIISTRLQEIIVEDPIHEAGLGIHVHSEDEARATIASPPLKPTINGPADYPGGNGISAGRKGSHAGHSRTGSEIIEAHHHRPETPPLRPDTPGGGFRGRGGYNTGRGGYNEAQAGASALPPEAHHRPGTPSVVPHEQNNRPGTPSSAGFTGRGGYNEVQGRGGYNEGRGGYNEEDDRPGTPRQRPSSRAASPATGRRNASRSPAPSRRGTLTPLPGIRVTDGEAVSVASVKHERAHSSTDDSVDVDNDAEISDGDLSWDSELDFTDSEMEELEAELRAPLPGVGAGLPRPVIGRRWREPEPEESEDEVERDPWNAVCVVGLRVYSKDTQVKIEVVKPKEKAVESKTLDVDDREADATRGLGMEETRDGAEEEEKVLGSAPANVEENRQG